MYYVYLVECVDKTLYCGYTTDIEKRIFDHNNSKRGAKYTSTRRPVKLVYKEEFSNLNDALKREFQIKRLKRVQKELLIKSMLG